MKKIVKVSGVVVGVFLLLLFVLPIAFGGKINRIVKEQINANLNADVGFKDVSLSFLRSFPSLSADVQELCVVNKKPFAGDTLVKVEHAYFSISLLSLFSEPKVNRIKITDAYINIKVDKDSVANYDIALPSDSEIESKAKDEVGESKPFSLSIDAYSLENINLNYVDEVSSLHTKIVDFNHSGSGDLSKDVLSLETHTNASEITIAMGDIVYLKKLKLKYDATVGVDYSNDLALSFKDNVLHFNDLHLLFDGGFTLLEDGYSLDVNFSSKESKFKSLLSLIPNAFTKDFPKVETTGGLDFKGKVKGLYSESSIPTMDIEVKTENASLKYPDLPNQIKEINLDTHITNASGVMDDTKVEVKDFGFRILNDVIKAKVVVTKPISNLTVSSAIDGKVDLGNLKNAYPIPPLEYELKGMIEAHLSSYFDMNSITKEKYQNIKKSGNIKLQDFTFGSDFTPNPILVEKTKLTFNTKNVSLEETTVKTGESDIRLKGTLDNLYGYVFSNRTLKGSLDVKSNLFKVSDFYEADTTSVLKEEGSVTKEHQDDGEQIKIPANIYALANVEAKRVVYDNMELSSFKGEAIIEDQKITFSNANANVFKGSVALNGYVDTKPNKTAYNFDLKLKQVDIASAFNGMGMLQKIAPIIGAFNGRFDTDLDLNGALGNDFMPDLSMLTGAAFANLQVDKIDASKNQFLSLAENKMSFLDFSKTDLKDLKTRITFKESKVNVQPFTFQYKDIPVTIGGSHSFDNQMNYSLKLDVPAKYLGNQAQSLVSSLSGSDQNNIKVPLNVKVGGTVTKPTVAPDMKSAVSSLAKATLNHQKSKLKTKAQDKIINLLGGASKDTTSSGKSSKDEIKKTGKKLLNSLFGN
ncbi:hypothetical protein [Wenyingzhuangia sp. IMCC45574]